MANYPKIAEIVRMATPNSLASVAIPYLIEIWLTEYWINTNLSDVVETTQKNCSYLFDIHHGRLIAAWIISQGHYSGMRDASRMRGHPQGFGSKYHRGHTIPHSAGGGTDINLVPQLGSVNVGSFRLLEKEAIANVGSLYFTHWIYADESQKPNSVEQGVLRAGFAPSISVHGN